jgi:hypothetical protein
MNGLMAAGQGLQAWALGLVLTLVFLDVGPGFSRDHPSLTRRMAGAAVGPLAGISLALSIPTCSLWQLLATCVPFTVLSIWYSWAWWFRWRASQRRSLGQQAAVLGGITLLLMMLTGGPHGWSGGIVAAAYIASVGLLGGLTVLAIMAWTERAADEVPECKASLEVPCTVVAVGLGITGLAALESLGYLVSSYALDFWLACSLLVPAGLLVAARRLWPRFARILWSGALVSALVGQGTIHTLMMTVHGLIPPAGL